MAKKNIADKISVLKSILGWMTQTEADVRYPRVSEGEAIEIYSQSQINSMVGLPFSAQIIEQKARVANKYTTYAGTVRMVGAGQTYSTFNAAYAACSNGDIIKAIPGTYNASAESGGAITLNRSGIGVKICSSTGVASDVIIVHDSGTNAIVMGSAGASIFENLTFTSSLDAIYLSYPNYATCPSLVIRSCNVTMSNAGSSSRFIYRGGITAGTDALWLEVDQCNILFAGSLTPLYYVNAGVNETFLVTKTTINATATSTALQYNSSNKGKVAVYDCTIHGFAGSYMVQFGEDGTPTNSQLMVDFRGNTVSSATFAGHAVLMGQGTKVVYFVNNTISIPSLDNALCIGLVIKTIASAYGNSYFAGNTITAPRPLYFKGAVYNIAKFNYLVSNHANWEGVGVLNPTTPLISATNNLSYNCIIGGLAAVVLWNTASVEFPAVTLQGWVINGNKYYSPSGYWMRNDVTYITFANKLTFWTVPNDSQSEYLILPASVRKVPFFDYTTTVN